MEFSPSDEVRDASCLILASLNHQPPAGTAGSQDPKQANNRKYRMPDKSNCALEEVPYSGRDDGGDRRHSGLPLTKLRGFPKVLRKHPTLTQRKPYGNRVNFSSSLTRFASSLTCDRC